MMSAVIGMSLPAVLNKVGFYLAIASDFLTTSIGDTSDVLVYLFITSNFLAIG